MTQADPMGSLQAQRHVFALTTSKTMSRTYKHGRRHAFLHLRMRYKRQPCAPLTRSSRPPLKMKAREKPRVEVSESEVLYKSMISARKRRRKKRNS